MEETTQGDGEFLASGSVHTQAELLVSYCKDKSVRE